MGNELLLAAVTAILKNRLENGLAERGVAASLGGDATVSTLPPDRITTGEDERAQLNVFLYGVAAKGLFSARSAPRDDAQVPTSPTVLELDYLLTAYGAGEYQIEVLLGYTLQLWRETPVLSGGAIRGAFASLASTEGGRIVLPALAALRDSPLGTRLETLKIVQQTINTDELSKMWSSLQARYRPSLAYKVTVSLSDSPRP